MLAGCGGETQRFRHAAPLLKRPGNIVSCNKRGRARAPPGPPPGATPPASLHAIIPEGRLMNDTSKKNRQPGFSTRAIHHAYDPAEHQGALTPPIFMTSTYAFETAEAGGEMFKGERAGYIYGRTKNPTQTVLKERIASLEGGAAAMAVGSGMAATSCVLLSLLSAGDEIVIDHTLYGNTFA